jgi:hypothetical protein
MNPLLNTMREWKQIKEKDSGEVNSSDQRWCSTEDWFEMDLSALQTCILEGKH